MIVRESLYFDKTGWILYYCGSWIAKNSLVMGTDKGNLKKKDEVLIASMRMLHQMIGAAGDINESKGISAWSLASTFFQRKEA